MKVNQLGEFNLIKLLATTLDKNFKSVNDFDDVYKLLVGIGDDAAVWEGPAGRMVFTSDSLVNNVHFDFLYINPNDLGWKAIVASQSDIAAMGFSPLFATISLGLTGDETVDTVKSIYEGIAEACSEFGGKIVGGDTVKSETLFISVSMIGCHPSDTCKTDPLNRESAKVGDLIAVTGNLGSSAGGLRVLIGEEKQTPRNKSLIEAHKRPIPQIQTGLWLATHGVSCSTDISDGLIDDLGRICRASNVGARIRIDNIPVSKDLKAVFPSDWIKLSLSGGEDYQLVFTGSDEIISMAIDSLETPITVIGEITKDYPDINILNSKGIEETSPVKGFDHFTNI